ncbi:hypothetical protein EVJ58_g9767 [Rhodofomes roseus]|uniref:Uncharacterized protein n=1 Tax=Rhodofomes roseus TaxID=34475 RepID=A0A4Y9XRC0_9APHY|nr:hypothetical protein EVJ58_g9767 [Rhodofomes roseus]
MTLTTASVSHPLPVRPTSASTSAPKPLAERLSAPRPLPDFKRKSAEDAKGILLKKVHATADRFQAIFDKKHLFDHLDGNSQKALHRLADQLNWVDDNIDKVSTWSKEQRERISWACKQVGRVEFSTDTESLARRYRKVARELTLVSDGGYLDWIVL